jgi:hypothetical protein
LTRHALVTLRHDHGRLVFLPCHAGVAGGGPSVPDDWDSP